MKPFREAGIPKLLIRRPAPQSQGGCNVPARREFLSQLLSVAAAGSASTLLSLPTYGAEHVRVGKAVPQSFAFALIDVGLKAGLFQKRGLDLEVTAFPASPQLQQAIAARSIDVGFSSGPDMALTSKGAPVKAVAELLDAPDMTIIVKGDGPVQSITGLRGKRVTVGSATSITGWFLRYLSHSLGWGDNGIVLTPSSLGSGLALLKTDQVAGMVVDLATGLQAESRGDARVLVRFENTIQRFPMYVVFASNDMIAQRPQVIRSFLAAWFDTVQYASQSKSFTVAAISSVLNSPPVVISRVYDDEIPKFSRNGRFDPAALVQLQQSVLDLGIVHQPIDLKQAYTEEFLPR